MIRYVEIQVQQYLKYWSMAFLGPRELHLMLRYLHSIILKILNLNSSLAFKITSADNSHLWSRNHTRYCGQKVRKGTEKNILNLRWWPFFYKCPQMMTLCWYPWRSWMLQWKCKTPNACLYLTRGQWPLFIHCSFFSEVQQKIPHRLALYYPSLPWQ